MKTPEEVIQELFNIMIMRDIETNEYIEHPAVKFAMVYTDQFRFEWKYCPNCGIRWGDAADKYGCSQCGTVNHLQPLPEAPEK